jgi:hypothetical protein
MPLLILFSLNEMNAQYFSLPELMKIKNLKDGKKES